MRLRSAGACLGAPLERPTYGVEGVRRSLLRSVVFWSGAVMLPRSAWSQSTPRSFDPSVSAPSPQEQQIELDRALEKILRGVPIQSGRVKVTAPMLADNGNSVSCSILVDSPMTEVDHVRELHVLLARNPRPLALSVAMSPSNSVARVDTRLRLAGSQRILAVAVMSDGRAWSGFTDVVVTLSACLDGS